MKISGLLFLFLFYAVQQAIGQNNLIELKEQYLKCRSQNNQECALKISEKMFLESKQFGDTSYWFNLSKRYQGNVLVSMNRKDEALQLYTQILPYYIQRRDEDLAILLNNIGLIYLETGLFPEARNYLVNSLLIFDSIHYPSSKLLNYLYNFRQLYIQLEEKDQIINIQNRILNELINLNEGRYIEELNSLLFFYDFYNEEKEFIKLSKQIEEGDALSKYPIEEFTFYLYQAKHASKTLNVNSTYELFEKTFSLEENYPELKQSEVYFYGRQEFSNFLNTNADFQKCIDWNITSLKIIDEYQHKIVNLDFLRSNIYNELTSVYCNLNDFEQAIKYSENALFYNQKYLSENDLDPSLLANKLNYLVIKFHTGDYRNLEREFLDLEQKFKISGIPQYKYINLYLYLYRINDILGNNQKADFYLNSYCSTVENNKELIENEDFVQSKIEKIQYLYQKDSIFLAKILIEDIEKDSLISETSKAIIFFTHAQILENMDPIKSNDYLMKSINLKKLIYGSKHPLYLNSLEFLANIQIQNQQYKEALLNLTYIDSIKTSLSSFPTKFQDLNYKLLLCICDLLSNSQSQYAIDVKALSAHIEKLMIGNFSIYTNSEKLKFIKDLEYYSQALALPQYLDENSQAIQHIYDFNLITKGLVLESNLLMKSKEIEDTSLSAKSQELKNLKSTLIEYEVRDFPQDKKQELISKIELIEKKLNGEINLSLAYRRIFDINWRDIQQNLSPTDAAIEFIRFYDDRDSSYKYMALLLRRDYTNPKVVILGSEIEINSYLHSPLSRDYLGLYKILWQDLDPLLQNINRVYYSPVGILNNVPFSALCNQIGDSTLSVQMNDTRGVKVILEQGNQQSCNSYLMDKYELHQLTTTRFLADSTFFNCSNFELSALLFGGLDYDQTKQAKSESKDVTKNNLYLEQKLNSLPRHDSSYVIKSMEYLPGTKEEVTEISTLIKSKSWKVQIKTEEHGTEDKLKKLLENKSPGVIHIATHGFSFPDEAKKETSMMSMEKESTYKVSEDPMVRCGLMLSGSNISWTGNPQKMLEQTGDDGILTAAEVANLDLSNTKLVVLSACETGLGKIEGSEGTFGLKRGFKLAGVEQLIVSLWSVPDKETMELMTLFYTDLTQTLNPVISFEKAQKEMRNRYPTEPDKWAGFVLVR